MLATTIFDAISAEVSSDAVLLVAFSLVGVVVTIAFYLWDLARKSIQKVNSDKFEDKW